MSGFVARMQLALVLVLLACSQSPAHDSWISRGGLRNAAGEWCCGEGDCFHGSGRPGARHSRRLHALQQRDSPVLGGTAVARWRVLAMQAARRKPTLFLRAAIELTDYFKKSHIGGAHLRIPRRLTPSALVRTLVWLSQAVHEEIPACRSRKFSSTRRVRSPSRSSTRCATRVST